jgi:hypothetical protein
VPALFGQMLLPAAASTLLDELAKSDGRHVLFNRLRKLAGDVIALGENTSAAAELACAWIDEQIRDPLPDEVVTALRAVQPMLENDPVMVQGFRAWARTINPAAPLLINEIGIQTSRRGLEAVSVIVLPAPSQDWPEATK